MLGLAVGATDTSLDIRVVDDDGLPVTGLVAATMPPVVMSKGSGADISVSLVDLAALTTSHTDGGIKERGGGVYRFDPPDTIASTAKIVLIRGDATGKRLLCPLIQVGLQDAIIAAIEVAVAAIPPAVVYATTAEGEPDGTTITCKVGEIGVNKYFDVLDENDDPVDIVATYTSAVLVINDRKGNNLQVEQHADLTISGAGGNRVTFLPDASLLDEPGRYPWAYRKTATGTPLGRKVIASGVLVVTDAPDEEA